MAEQTASGLEAHTKNMRVQHELHMELEQVRHLHIMKEIEAMRVAGIQAFSRDGYDKRSGTK
jgi:hypothetical protein